jgi:simple sugar transport system ATP-binding protein
MITHRFHEVIAFADRVENMAFRGFDRPPLALGGTWLRPAKMRAAAERRIAQYRIRTRSLDAPLAALAGDNVQRAVLAGELEVAVGDADRTEIGRHMAGH